jgi:hypothetical protein
MTHKQIPEAFGFRRLQVLSLGHDWEGPNVRTAEPRIVVMMIAVRAAPNAAGAKSENPEDSHEDFSKPGPD